MTAAQTMQIALDQLGRLIPMHVLVAPDGAIRSIGPTLLKALAMPVSPGAALFQAFEVRRPRGIGDMEALRRRGPGRFMLARRGEARAFRCFALPTGDGGLIVKTSFGTGLIEAVADCGLTDADFSPTDNAIEVLYLREATTVIMAELDATNARLSAARSAAEAQAMTDMLTGLCNRRALDLSLEQAATGAQPFGLMHIDLDFFKAVNDSLGHAAGDHVLREVARILREETRQGDTVARVGGDEFAVILQGLVDRAALTRIAERLIARLSVPIPFDGRPCRISASIGIALSTDYARPDPGRILGDADTALYASKHAGRGRAMFHAAA